MDGETGQESTSETYTYRIDKDDIVTGVSDNWRSFAVENSCAGRCRPEDVVGASLWDFITGMETRYLYETVLKRVRDLRRPAALQFRCDSPDIRRFLELTVIPLNDEAVEFRSRVIRTEARDPVALLKSDVDRSDEFVTICSMCKKIAVSDTDWEELEQAVNTLKLFEAEKLPNLTHGLCKKCYQEAREKIK